MNPPSKQDTWIGRCIGDRQRYRLDKRLAEGGMGDVFSAMDTLLGKQVALKLLKDTLVGSGELRKRFEREVALCAALKSDHIVEVSDYGVTPEGYPFYVMEYLRGQSLGQLMRQQKRLPVERTVGIITQVCEGLQLAHKGVTLWRDGATASEHIKVVHRDLKPDNIFLVPTALGELVKILDFGVAKIRSEAAENTNLTGMFLGTFRYAAPEQLEVAKDLDARADIYSLGIILYEMISGTDPFGFGIQARSTSGVSWAMAHKSKPPVPLRSQPGLSQLSKELEAVVMRCLQKAPSDRFARVDELNQALQAAAKNVISSTDIPRSLASSGQGSDNITVKRSLPACGQAVPDSTIVQPPSSPRAAVPDSTIVQPPPPPRAAVSDSTIVQPPPPPRAAVSDSTIVQPPSSPRAAVPDSTIVQPPSSPRAAVPDSTIVQPPPPPRAAVPDSTIAQVPLPAGHGIDETVISQQPAGTRGGVSNATSAQIPTPSGQRTRSLPTNPLLLLGIGIAIGLVVMGGIFAYIQLQPSETQELKAPD